LNTKEKLGKTNQFAKKGTEHPNFVSTTYKFLNKQLKTDEKIGNFIYRLLPWNDLWQQLHSRLIRKDSVNIIHILGLQSIY
jgi:hypothetical protein